MDPALCLKQFVILKFQHKVTGINARFVIRREFTFIFQQKNFLW
jgi:hypothetical protein